MMNRYLEKIAAWRELEPGVHYHDETGEFSATDEARKRIYNEENRRNTRPAIKALGTLGAAVGLGVGLVASRKNPFLQKVKRTAMATGIGGGAGALGGVYIGHSYNKDQDRRIGKDQRIADHIHRRAGRYDRTRHGRLFGGDNPDEE
jgi:hypothetical protein